MKTAKTLKDEIVELLKKASVALPEDIIFALKKARKLEKNSSGKSVLDTILENVAVAKKKSHPICQDTGTPIFYVKYPPKFRPSEIKRIIDESLNIATKNVPLRKNAVESLSGKPVGNAAIIHFHESDELEIKVLLKGAGSENVSAVYSLPSKEINAQRDLDGVGKCILETVFKAQGRGCPPYIIGVAIAGNIEEAAALSKKQLLRKIDEKNPDKVLRLFEEKILKQINSLRIGPLGLGGGTTALSVKIENALRHPATFFVGVSMGCWCLRRESFNKKS